MTRIADKFADLSRQGDGALIVFVTAGDPDPETSSQILPAIADAGADIIELGVPFSDPLADGPVIQAASRRALQHGVTLADTLALAAAFRAARQTPLILMTCYNPILQFGLSRFAREAARVGVDGLIITDLPPEESQPWVEVARDSDIDTVFLLAPTSSSDRMKIVVDLASGFVYCVSRMGVTGAREALPSDLAKLVARIRKQTDKPVAVGFGIATPQHVSDVCSLADGAVVGSALVSLIERERRSGRMPQAAGEFVAELKAATRGRRGSRPNG